MSMSYFDPVALFRLQCSIAFKAVSLLVTPFGLIGYRLPTFVESNSVIKLTVLNLLFLSLFLIVSNAMMNIYNTMYNNRCDDAYYI